MRKEDIIKIFAPPWWHPIARRRFMRLMGQMPRVGQMEPSEAFIKFTLMPWQKLLLDQVGRGELR